MYPLTVGLSRNVTGKHTTLSKYGGFGLTLLEKKFFYPSTPAWNRLRRFRWSIVVHSIAECGSVDGGILKTNGDGLCRTGRNSGPSKTARVGRSEWAHPRQAFLHARYEGWSLPLVESWRLIAYHYNWGEWEEGESGQRCQDHGAQCHLQGWCYTIFGQSNLYLFFSGTSLY